MNPDRRYSKTSYLILCSLFAALLAICSYITIPLPFTPIPLNLGMLGVFLAGGLLGPKYGAISAIVYVLMGAVGMPVFAGFQGGLGIIAGPVGGFIVGYPVAVFITGLVVEKGCPCIKNAAGQSSPAALCISGMSLGLLTCYSLGTLWFMVTTGTGIGAAMVSCVIPFIPADIIKILAGTLLISKLRPLIL